LKPLLIEIGLEEAPAASLIRALGEIEDKYKNALETFGFSSPFSFDFTPRRLAFYHPSFLTAQKSRVEIAFGPPLANAVANGKPTEAALGFAKKCGVAFEELGKSTQKGREVLSYERRVEGRTLNEVLGDLLTSFLRSLDFGKTMRWGSLSYEFIRPVRWLLALRGEEKVDCEVFGVKSGDFTFAHRSYSFDPQKVKSAENYEKFLLERGVILSAKKRREIILTQFKQIEETNDVHIEIDEELLDEVTAITEYPNALLGKFDRYFLELPSEVVITSMKVNQRYFAAFKNGELTNAFVVVANAFTEDFSAVIAGNEKVLRPRLNDALFFWRNDLKSGLQEEPLKQINYAQNLGSIYDKQKREQEIVKRLQTFFGVKDEFVERAAALSKRDLATQMVYEFTELQGVMGMRYALKLGENEAVARALYEQYLPLGEDSPPPKSQTGALLAIAVKIDALMALFSIGLIPTGSKDPFGLRRAAASTARIALDREWSLSIDALIKTLGDLYKPFDYGALKSFFKERLYSVLGGAASIIKAVTEAGEDDVLEIAKKVRALEALVKNESFKNNFALFKRVANILKDCDLSALKVDPKLFETDEELELFKASEKIESKDYSRLLSELFALEKPLDRFFNAVLVNAQDPAIRANRLGLLSSVYKRFLTIADIKEIGF
jgi:glycyl-tRNA synthetase beta chain